MVFDYEKFIELIKARMLESGLNQREFAKRIGISESILSRYLSMNIIPGVHIYLK